MTRPAKNNVAPATSIGACTETNLVRNNTATANPIAETIASISP